MNYQSPVKLTSPRVWRTYMGGSLIDAIHGIPQGCDSQFPEEWIMSVVTARNAGREQIPDEGLCYLDGTRISLKDYIRADPRKALGNAHFQTFGASTGVLVKIIDAAERLTVQVHPNKQRAMELFHSPFGKTECWHILNCRTVDGEAPCIYLGFKENITREYWMQLFREQNIPAMLDCLHRFPAKPGETYLVNAGVPHAIGAGCLLVEIQEPTDYTVRTERVSPNGLVITDHLCHQGLGFERMFDCFDYLGLSFPEARKRWCISPRPVSETPEYTRTELIGPEDTPCFRLERYDVRSSCAITPNGTMSGLYVLSGSGRLHSAGKSQSLSPGTQFFVPADCARFTVAADTPITLFRCYGPASPANFPQPVAETY